MPAALPLLSREHAVFLDYDGTLVSFESHAAQVFLPERRLNTLRTLFQHLDEGLCIISGRDVRNLSQRVPKDVWRAGSHGLEYCLPDHLPNHPPAPARTHHSSPRTESILSEKKNTVLSSFQISQWRSNFPSSFFHFL